uniref:Uncharacterized protein n=1 Tax=Tetranychus urticae TaxID=32264 RepID=T1KIV4_TETUR
MFFQVAPFTSKLCVLPLYPLSKTVENPFHLSLSFPYHLHHNHNHPFYLCPFLYQVKKGKKVESKNSHHNPSQVYAKKENFLVLMSILIS